jgi:RNA polymerase sigma-70 factor (ECF subfamily)
MRDDFPAPALSVRPFNAQIASPFSEDDVRGISGGQLPGETARSPSEEPTDHALIDRSRAGDQNAATTLYVRYSKRLTSLVRRRCPAPLARTAGVEDIVQSVFGVLFQRISKGLYDVPDGDELWKLILVIALNKIRAKATYYQALKRDRNRAAAGAATRQRIPLQEITDGPGLEHVELVLEEILERLPAPNRLMAQLRIDGYKVAEVAELTGRSRRSVERILQETRLKLAELLQQED